MQILTAQELHNLAMNIVGEKLTEMGYEFQAINSQLKRHPQFVLFKKGEPTIFVLVKATNHLQNPNEYDTIWMETCFVFIIELIVHYIIEKYLR